MEFSLSLFNRMAPRTGASQLLEINAKSVSHGLTLIQSDAMMLIENRNRLLSQYGRLEIGNGILAKLVETFCDSAYLWQENYAETLARLVEIFYYAKNETEDKISDLELIELMKDFFNHRSEGSLELLQNRDLEAVANNIRHGIENYKDPAQTYTDEPEEKIEEIDWNAKARNWLTDNLDYGDGVEGEWGHLYDE